MGVTMVTVMLTTTLRTQPGVVLHPRDARMSGPGEVNGRRPGGQVGLHGEDPHVQGPPEGEQRGGGRVVGVEGALCVGPGLSWAGLTRV